MSWLQNSIAVVISFLIARIMIDADIHRSYVHHLLKKSHSDFSSFITGILSTSYFFSIFFSNTVVVLSMIPVVKIILEGIEDPQQRERVSTPVVLALIYGANIGGMASLTGCPLNIVFSGFLEINKIPGKENVTFFSWLLLGIPATLALIIISRLVLKLGEKGMTLDSRISFGEKTLDPKMVKKYTFFFITNMLILVILTAVQFMLKPRGVLFGLNPVDILMSVYLAGFLFFSFIFPRGKRSFRSYKKNLLHFLLFVILLIPIGFVELARDIILRFRIRGMRFVKKVDSGLLSGFNRVWFFFFKEKRESLKTKNPYTFVSLNRLVYDLPFFGLLFMGIVLLFVFIIVKLGDNPATGKLDGYVLTFLENFSVKFVPSGDHVFLFLLAVVMVSIFFTEIVNNTAVVLIMFPLILKVIPSLPFDPMFALLAVTTAASGAFMTPIATPVNAISFAGVKGVSLKKMLALGVVLNILSGIWIAVLFYLLGH
jgi:sodium-dependent dicarboxylate transporter 2/3/5